MARLPIARIRFSFGVGLALAFALAGCTAEPDPGPRMRLGVVTALPLFWAEGARPADILSGTEQRAPLIRALAQRHDVRAVDAIDAASLKGIKILMLVQPRLLHPAELVTLDQWVRDGGRMIIFADPVLVWPSDLALGDRRRAPGITLLDPLYQHWGLALDSPPPDGPPIVDGAVEGQKVALVSPGRWRLSALAHDCVIESGALVADCHLGRGEVVLIADADMLDARLWAEKNVDATPAVLALVARLARADGTT